MGKMSSDKEKSMGVVMMCAELTKAIQRLNREAGKVGLGERTPFSERELAEVRAIALLGRKIDVIDRVVLSGKGLADVPSQLLPPRLVEHYALLWDHTYGPSGMQGVGDESTIHGIGKGQQMRVSSSGQRTWRSGAITKRDKSKRNVVKSSEMFDFKRRIDARLSRIAGEIQLFLEGGRDSVAGYVKQCRSCKRICANDWRYCASCGSTVTNQEE